MPTGPCLHIRSAQGQVPERPSPNPPSALGQRNLGDEMPVLLQPPGLSHALSENLDQNVTASVLRLCSLLASPPECPQLKSVVSVSLRCLTRFHSVGGVLPTEVTSFVSGLGQAAAQLAQTPEEATPFYLAGREKQFQAWHNLIKMPTDGCESLEMAIGAELSMAFAVQREFRPRIAATVREVLVEHMKGDPVAAALQAKALADRLMTESIRVLSRSVDMQPQPADIGWRRPTEPWVSRLPGSSTAVDLLPSNWAWTAP